MNIGTISMRYARALYSLAFEQGQEDSVYNELTCMLSQFLQFPEMKRYLTSPIMKAPKKVEMLEIAAGGTNLSPITKSFIDFVVRREKQDLIQFMCVAYQSVYRKAKNILATKFISATEVDAAILEKIRTKIEESYNANVEFEVKVDKNLIGGFILDVDNNRIDASVLGELNKMKVAFRNKESV